MNRNAYPKPRRTYRLLTLLALALLLAAVACGCGRAYHLRLAVDTERLSPTVAGADARTGLQLTSQLRALSMDGDVALADLFDPDSELGTRFGSTAAVGETVQGIMEYLGSYDARLGSDRSLLQQIDALLRRIALAKTALLLLSAAVGLLILTGVGLFLTGRDVGANLLLALAALPTSALPTLLLLGVQRLGARFSDALGVAARYGVGFTAELSLTRQGVLQAVFGAAALLLCSVVCLRLGTKRNRREKPHVL